MKKFQLIAAGILSICLFASGCGSTAAETASDSVGISESEEENIQPETEDAVEAEDASQETEIAEAEETEEEAEPLTYVEENGLTFSQELSGTMQGCRYNSDDITDYEFIDTEWEITGITIEDAEEEGYLTVTVEAVNSGYIWVEILEDGTEHYRSYIVVSALHVCDMYTGIIVPTAATWGDMSYDYSAEVEWEGQTYSIGYTDSISWESGDWLWDPTDWIEGDNEKYTKYKAAHTTLNITIPEDYDGLAFLWAPVTEPPEEDEDYGEVDDSETKYLMDEWEDGCALILMQDAYEALNE